MRYLNITLALLCTAMLTLGVNAQSLRPADLVQSVQAEAGFEESFSPFITQKSAGPFTELDAVGADYEVFTLQSTDLSTIQKSAPTALQLELPGTLALRTLFAPTFSRKVSASRKVARILILKKAWGCTTEGCWLTISPAS